MASRSTGSNTSRTSSTEDADVPNVPPSLEIVKLWPGRSEQQSAGSRTR